MFYVNIYTDGLINISDNKMNVDFNFLECPSLVAKCSLKSSLFH